MLIVNSQRSLLWAALALFVLPTSTVRAADAEAISAAVESISVDDLRRHVNVLASDTLEGREAGSRGGKAAGAYLIDTLKKLGAQPGAGKSFSQFFGANYRNILAVLPGSDPELNGEYVILSSHYDHVGFGSARNSYGPIGRIHNGADDNASGTSGVMEVLEALTNLKPAPRRSILFAFWDAEEKGLLGSEHWVAHPTVPLNNVKLMFNVDMIGRLRDNSLEMYGVRTAAGLRRLLCEQNRDTDLTLSFNWDNKRESDHYPFFARRIPYLMFHTRKHENYHRPSDDVDTLNLDGMTKVARLMFRTTLAAADAPRLPEFRNQAVSENSGYARSRRAIAAGRPPRLDVEWDKKLAAEGIVRIARVRPGSSAARSGLKAGDRILRIGLYDVNSAATFQLALLAANSPVAVSLQRAGTDAEVQLSVELNGNPERIGITFDADDAEPGLVRITRVTPGSAADNAGLKPNHRIYEVAGRRFGSRNEFHGLVSTLPSPLTLLVEGGGRMREVELKLLPATETPVRKVQPSDSP